MLMVTANILYSKDISNLRRTKRLYSALNKKVIIHRKQMYKGILMALTKKTSEL